jgi:hypothetical protein
MSLFTYVSPTIILMTGLRRSALSSQSRQLDSRQNMSVVLFWLRTGATFLDLNGLVINHSFLTRLTER